MRRLQEVDEKVHDVLVGDEAVVREIRVHGAWLVITNHRLLMYDTSVTGHPRDVVFEAPLHGIDARWGWVWSRLDRRVVIRTDDGRTKLVRVRSRRSRGAAAADLVGDIRHWSLVEKLADRQVALGHPVDEALAHVQAMALEAITPGQLARALGLDPTHVRQVLRESVGVHVSRGAALGYSYTRRDRQQFDVPAKEQLFSVLVAEMGADTLVEHALGVGGEWWESSLGKGVEELLAVVDVEMGHASERRWPIARWQRTFLWIGFATAAITAIAVIPPAIWIASWKTWRGGDSRRPSAAIGLGVLAVGLIAVAVLAAVI